MSDLANKCMREMLLHLFGEESAEIDNSRHGSSCCDVCENGKEAQTHDLLEELKILYNAIDTIGSKEELKISQWIRGSALS